MHPAFVVLLSCIDFTLFGPLVVIAKESFRLEEASRPIHHETTTVAHMMTKT